METAITARYVLCTGDKKFKDIELSAYVSVVKMIPNGILKLV